VLLIAAIPAILEVLLGLLLLRQSRVQRGRAELETFAGVAAVLLAILPIRLVLVPTSIVSLTIVDYWLGLLVALLIGLASLAVRTAFGVSRRA
jgi:hypothetical protein